MTHSLAISEQLHEQIVYVKQMLREMTGQDISDEELISLLLSAFAQSVTHDHGGGCCGGGCGCDDEGCGDGACGCNDEEFDEEAHHLKHTHKNTQPTSPAKKTPKTPTKKKY